MEVLKAAAMLLTSIELGTDRSRERHSLGGKLLMLVKAFAKQNVVVLSLANVYMAVKRLANNGRSARTRTMLAFLLHVGALLKLLLVLKKQYDSRMSFILGLAPTIHKKSGQLALSSIGKWSSKRYLQATTPLLNFKLELFSRSLSQAGSLKQLKDVYYTPLKVQRQSLDVFYKAQTLPTQRSEVRVVLWLHGGAWIVGSKGLTPPLFADLVEANYVVVAANYRLVNLEPVVTVVDQIRDIKCCIAWIKSELAPLLGMSSDAVQVFLGGSSAGGHLALCCALTQNEPYYQPPPEWYSTTDTSICCCIDLFGPKSVMPGSEHNHRLFGKGYDGFVQKYLVQEKFSTETRGSYHKLSPVELVNSSSCPEMPPILGFHGTFDCWVSIDESREFYAAVAQRRQTSSKPTKQTLDALISVPGAPHGFHVLNSNWSFALSDALIIWLDQIGTRAHR